MRTPLLRLVGAAVFCAAAGAIAALIWFGPAADVRGEPSFERGTESADAAQGGRGGSVWGKDYFPDVELITHEGERLRFFEDMIEDKVVAINFIYTTCPDACPMETARLREVADLLGDRMGEDVFFYSITIDPENDTPEVLAEHVENWQVGPGWKFLTGEEEDIVLLRQKLGIYIEEIQAEDSNDHNLTLIIGNQSTGQWIKRSPYENPHILATQLGGWLHNWSMPRETERSYEDAPELRDISTGELLFRTRCESCHSVGRGDVARDARRLGPDLYNVTEQRDPEWLERWLKEPDVMLEEEDPLAMALYEEYNRVPMPNLRLTDKDVENVLAYIEERSAEIRHHVEAGHRPPPGEGGAHGEHHAQHMDHGGHGEHAAHAGHGGHEGHGDHEGHGGHGDHEGHEGHGDHEGRGDHEGHGDPHAGHGPH